MRTLGVLALPALLLALPAPVRAQEGDTIPKTVSDATLPADVAAYVAEFYNAPGTIQFVGRTRIPSERTVSGDVAVLDGPLVLAGRIEGNLVVINGDVEMLDGAAVTGHVTVVGGQVLGAGNARIGGETAVYAAPLEYRRRGERLVVRGRSEGGVLGRINVGTTDDGGFGDDREERRRGRADFIVATGNSYNRVEGLPITFGPVFETAGSNPLRLRVMGIFRTEGDGGAGAERWGFEGRLEQFLGGRRALRVGGTLFHKVSPIEAWHLSDLENGLSTFFAHRDFRDHYQREGGSVYAMLTPPSTPLTAKVELRSESHKTLLAGSPWSLFDNNEEWRLQPLVGEGTLNSLAFSGTWDTRSDERDPASGWLIQAEVEQALDADLTRRSATLTPGGDVGPGATPLLQQTFDRFTHGFLDIRRYNRISPSSRLNMRLLAGGALTGATLPPQRQHALGGEGSLPGYSLFSVDCGARDLRTFSDVAGEDDGFYPAYGCDRFVLGQVEYRGDVSFRIDLGDWGDGDDEEWEDGEVTERDLHADFGWVLFADVGRGWTRSTLQRDEPTAADIGVGLVLGDLGAYIAVPVSDGGGINFFIRLNNRF